MMTMRAACLYVPPHTRTPIAERIAALALARCEAEGWRLVAAAWHIPSVAAVVARRLVAVVIAVRAERDLSSRVEGAGGQLVLLRPGRPPRAAGGLGDALAALVAAGRLDADVAAELAAAAAPDRTAVDPERRPRRLR